MDSVIAPPWPKFLRAEVIALGVTLMVQVGGIVWGYSQLSARVGQLEAKVSAAAHQSEDIARIDERTKSIDESVSRIERRIDGNKGGDQ